MTKHLSLQNKFQQKLPSATIKTLWNFKYVFFITYLTIFCADAKVHKHIPAVIIRTDKYFDS